MIRRISIYLTIIIPNLFSLCVSYIIIPFTSEMSKIENNLSPKDIMNKLILNDLYTNIDIGTPPQNLNFTLNFHSYQTYILNYNSSRKFIQYNKNISSTYISLNDKSIFFQGNDFQSAFNSSDKISINKYLKDYNLNFLLIKKENEDTNINFSGSFGLSVVDCGEPLSLDSGLLYNLKKNNLIDNYIFTLIFNKDNFFEGKVIVGKNIYDKYIDDYFHYSHCIIDYNYNFFFWGWNNFKVNYKDNSFNIYHAYFKPNSGVIICSLNIQKILKNDFFDNKISEKKCFEENSTYHFFYCDNDVDINIQSFKFLNNKDNITFQINKEDLIYNYNHKKYFLMVFDKNLKSDTIYLGIPFLKKYDIIFDQDKRHSGFYNFKIDFKEDEKEEKNDKKIIPEQFKVNYLWKKISLIIMFLIILLFIYILFYLYRDIRRKQAKKIIAGFEYSEI